MPATLTLTDLPKRSAERPYARICRQLVNQICAEKQITKTQLAKDLGVNKFTILSLAGKGILGFDLALRIAEVAKAPPEVLGEMERAWFLERATMDARGPLRRLLLLFDLVWDELGMTEAFLKEQGLFDLYVQRRRKWDPKLGLIGKEMAEKRAQQAKGRRRRKP